MQDQPHKLLLKKRQTSSCGDLDLRKLESNSSYQQLPKLPQTQTPVTHVLSNRLLKRSLQNSSNLEKQNVDAFTLHVNDQSDRSKRQKEADALETRPLQISQYLPTIEQKDEIPCFQRLQDVQERVSVIYPSFPMQANIDFVDKNYEMIIGQAATQIDYLFNHLMKPIFTNQNPTFVQDRQQAYNSEPGCTAQWPSKDQYSIQDTEQLVEDNKVAEERINALKTSLAKADEIMKNLRVENGYFQRQLENLRREVEYTKASQPQPRPRSFDHIQASAQNSIKIFSADDETASVHKPQHTILQPVPHPRPIPPKMYDTDFFSDCLPRRDMSSPRHMRSTSQTRQTQRHSQNSRTCSNQSVKRWDAYPNARKPLHASKRGQNEENIVNFSYADSSFPSQEHEIKSLRFELQQKSEMLTVKTETLRDLQREIDDQRRRMANEAQKTQIELQQEIIQLKQELKLSKNGEVSKEAAFNELTRQFEELHKSKTLEMNLLINKAPAGGYSSQMKQDSARNLHQKSSTAALGSSAAFNLQFAKDLNAEMESLFARKKPGSKKQKRREQRLVQFEARKQEKILSTMNPTIVEKQLLPCDTLLQNQIEAAVLAESLIDEINSIEKNKMIEVSDLKSSCTSLEVHSKTLLDENKNLSTRLEKLSNVNDELKSKFSDLLDQFQDYVTTSENKRLEEDEKNQKHQNYMLQNMQDNIHELEKVAESLQLEVQRKEEAYEAVKQENRQMQQKMVSLAQEENQNSRQALRKLENELIFLKQHHDEEIKMLNEQYERSLETQKLVAHEIALQQANSRRDFSIQTEAVCLCISSTGSQSMLQHTDCIHQYKPQEFVEKSFNFAPEIPAPINDPEIEKLRKDMEIKDQLLDEKNQELIRLRMTNHEGGPGYIQGLSRRLDFEMTYKPQLTNQSGQIVTDMSYSINELKTEILRLKQTLYAQTGRQINLDALPQSQSSSRQINRESDLQSEVMIQLSDIRTLITLTQEINMLAQSISTIQKQVLPQNDDFGTNNDKNDDNNYYIKRRADQLMRSNQISDLYSLVLDQIVRSETLMNEKVLMQRRLYTYEVTLAELDKSIKSEKRSKTIYELKKLVETQLKQILELQEQLDNNHQGGSHSPIGRDTLAKQDQITSQLQELRKTNEKLLDERKGLVDMAQGFETQAQDNHRNMEKALDQNDILVKQIEEKDRMLGEIRQKITKVAELFERSKIKQHYSFDVLCDFIYDKAKRLFSKYEAVSREGHFLMQDNYYQRKLEQTEKEKVSMKETNHAAELIMQEMIPNLATMLERPVMNDSDHSMYFYARTVLEEIEKEFRYMKGSNKNLQSLNKQYKQQLQKIMADLEEGHHNSKHKSSNNATENFAPNQQNLSFDSVLTASDLTSKARALANNSKNCEKITKKMSDSQLTLSQTQYYPKQVRPALEQRMVNTGTGFRMPAGGSQSVQPSLSWTSSLQQSYPTQSRDISRMSSQQRLKSTDREHKDCKDSPNDKLGTSSEQIQKNQASGALRETPAFTFLVGSHLTTSEDKK